jgi:peptidoglycan/LPS O-acetylase OafA/YrhL
VTASTAAAVPVPGTLRADIDGLRALSILLVVAFHAGIDRSAGGYVGVDVFFVLSGYLITGILVREQQQTGTIELLAFYARRARRLLPMAGLVLLTTLAMGLVLLPPLLRTGLIGDVRASALYVANWRFAAQSTAYSVAEVTDTLLLHYWSLSVESSSTSCGRC